MINPNEYLIDEYIDYDNKKMFISLEGEMIIRVLFIIKLILGKENLDWN